MMNVTKKELKSILVVEDDDADLALVLRRLKETDLGIEPAVARDLTTALAAMQRQPVDLVLLDLCLPDSFGVGTLLRFLTAFPDLPIVVLTGSSDEAMAKEALSIGALDYVQKCQMRPEVLRRTLIYAHERGHLYQELKNAAHSALELAQKRQDFLARMSHEIRTPLNGIIGALSLYNTDTGSAESDNQELIASAKVAADLLLQTVNDILDLAKIEAGKMTAHITPVNIWHLLGEVLDIYAPLASSKGLRLGGVFLCDPRAMISTDELRLRQILNNLVSNAIKFTDQGHICLQVELNAEGAPLFRVSDTGCGVDEADGEHLFGSFTQSEHTPTGSLGTGLGLAICKQFSELLGGKVGVRTGRDGGAEFWLSLPQIVFTEPAATGLKVPVAAGVELVADIPDDWQRMVKSQLAYLGVQAVTGDAGATPLPPTTGVLRLSASDIKGAFNPRLLLGQLVKVSGGGKAKAETNGVNAQPEYPGLRALVAEDVELSRELLVRMLRTLKIDCTAVNDGQAAVAAAANGPFDLILMDCHMPKVDGFTATERIRRMALHPGGQLPIIVGVTADCFAEAKARCLAAGMDYVLTKPLTLTEIVPFMARLYPQGSVGTNGRVQDEKISPPLSHTEVFDPQAFGAVLRLCGDSPLFSQLVQMFTVNTKSRFAELKDAVSAGDCRNARDIAHAIKGAACNFGATRLVAAAQKFEEEAQDASQASRWPEFVQGMEQEYERVCRHLEARDVALSWSSTDGKVATGASLGN